MRRFFYLLCAVLLLSLGPPIFAQSSVGPYTLSANSQCTKPIDTTGLSSLGMQITGTSVLTLQPEASIAGQPPANTQITPSTCASAPCTPVSTVTTAGATNALYSASVAGAKSFLLCVSAYTSGSAVIYFQGSNLSSRGIGAGAGGGSPPYTPPYFYNTGLAPRLMPTYLATENTPPTIVNTTYDVDGFTDMFPDGTFVIVYQSQPARGSNPTSVVMRTSTDQGGHWSAANVILAGSGSTTGYECCGGGVTNTGRLVVSYELVTSGTPAAFYTIYSDNEGATWSTPYQIASGEANTYGRMIPIGNGQLLLPNYNALTPPPYQSYVYISSDNGATWGSQITVLTSSTTVYSEGSYAYLGGETILGMVRCDNCTNNETQQVLSTDNGNTWTNQGGVNFQNDSLGNSPWLSTFMGPNGRRVVEWNTQLRSVNEEVATFGYASDLIAASNSSPLILGWNQNSQQVLGTFPNCQGVEDANGYGSVVHPFDSAYGLGRYFQHNADTCATGTSTTVFFTVPPNKAVPIDERINGTVSAAANSINWTPYFVNQGGVDYSLISVPTGDLHSIFIESGSASGLNVASGKHNIGIGFGAGGFNNAGGDRDIAMGFEALQFVGTGNDDVGIGFWAGSNLSGAQSGNTFIGSQAGNLISDDSTPNAAATNETMIGFDAYPSASGDSNEIVIGANSSGGGSNTSTIGNSSTTKFFPYGTVYVEGTAPTVSSNAGTGSLTHGTDNAGIIATGTASTASTLTFHTGWATWAACAVNASTATALPYVSAISASAVTFTYVTTGTPTLYYHCYGQ